MAYGTAKVDTLQTSTKTVQVDDLAVSADLGTAAAENVGTSAGNVVQLDGSARLPAVDGSQLTNLPTPAGTDLSYTASTRVLASSTGADATLPEATTSEAGLLSAADKTKLNGIAAADAAPQPLGAAAVGVSTDYAREDHVHAMPSAGDVGADPAGTASSAVSSHVAAADPHPGYALESSLGTAAALDVGTSAGNVVQLDGSGALPAVDGSNLTGIAAGGTPGGTTGQVQYNDGGSFAGDSGLTYDATTGALTVGGKTVSADAPVINLSQTWNNAGVTFTGLKLNVTNTASASASDLLDLQVGGTSRFKVAANASISITEGNFAGRTAINLPAYSHFEINNGRLWFQDNVGVIRQYFEQGLELWNAGYIGICPSTPVLSNADVRLYRDGANTFAQRNDTNAQTYRLYNTYTNASNYERGFLRWSSNVFEIGSEGAGTGSEKPVRITAATLKLPNLPTYADNAAATSGGLVAGDVYKTATGELRITV